MRLSAPATPTELLESSEMQEIQHALSEPFDPSAVHWKPQVVTGNRALAIPYIDARAVMDRLDHAAGVGVSPLQPVGAGVVGPSHVEELPPGMHDVGAGLTPLSFRVPFFFPTFLSRFGPASP
jgi:hypothetical protein